MSVVSKHTIIGRSTPRSRAIGTLGLSAVAIAGLFTAGASTLNEQAHAAGSPAPSVQASPAADVSNIGVSAASPIAAPAVSPTIAPAVVQTPKYTNDLDGWIREAMDIMKKNGIPGSYDAIYRNIMRESTGNPQAINLYDSNAAAGNPSKGLLQVIQTTFAAYHVPGTSLDIYDPVANIVAACNYAAHTYGSMDNVNSAY